MGLLKIAFQARECDNNTNRATLLYIVIKSPYLTIISFRFLSLRCPASPVFQPVMNLWPHDVCWPLSLAKLLSLWYRIALSPMKTSSQTSWWLPFSTVCTCIYLPHSSLELESSTLCPPLFYTGSNSQLSQQLFSIFLMEGRDIRSQRGLVSSILTLGEALSTSSKHSLLYSDSRGIGFSSGLKRDGSASCSTKSPCEAAHNHLKLQPRRI